MPLSNGQACSACGETNDLIQCKKCIERMANKGVSAAICKPCLRDPEKVADVGKRADSGSTTSEDFLCRPCITFEKRQLDEQLLASVGGPSPNEILKSIANARPWYMTIRRASPEQLLTALSKLKRRTTFASTANELAEGLASKEVVPALLLQSLSSHSADPLCHRALESYVTSKCPSIKYKHLLLPEHNGSLDKARRHFTDQTHNPDALVAALAHERLFLIEWVEKQSTPPQKRNARHALGVPDAPYEATEWVYCTFKSLSIKIKCTASRNEAANLLIKN